MHPRPPIAISLLLTALLIPPGAVAETAPQALRVGGGPGEVRFRVSFAAPEWVETQGTDRIYRYLEWPGIGEEGDFGSPAIPVTFTRVAVPREGPVELAVEVESRGRAGGLRFPPTPSPEEEVFVPGRRQDPGAARLSREGDAYRKSESPPWAEIASDGIERGLRVVTVAVRPVRWDPVEGDAEWASAVTVTLTLAPPARAPGAGRPRRPDSIGEAGWRSSLVNPEGADLFRAVVADSQTCAAGLPAGWFQAAPGWLKVHVAANGVYRLGRQELAAAGVPVASIDPRTIRLFSGPLLPEVGWAATGWDSIPCDPALKVGRRPHVYARPGFCGGIGEAGGLEEIAIWLKGEENGVFDSSDQVVFYALGPDNYRDRFGLPAGGNDPYLANPYTDETIYWLTWDAPSLPGSPRRMETDDATPVAAGPAITESRVRVHGEENTFRDPAVYQGGWRWEEWFWDYMRSDEGVKRYFVDLPHLAAGSLFDARIRLWGAKVPSRFDYGEARLHHVEVTVNGADQGISVWGGSTAVESITPQEVTATGVAAVDPAEFRFLVPAVASADEFRLDDVYLAWIDAVYLRTLALDGGAGELELESGIAGNTVRVTGSPLGTVEMFDVTDFRSPRRLTGSVTAGGATEFAWSRPGSGVVALASEASYVLPRKIALDDPPRDGSGSVRWLREVDAGLDYVIVTADELASEAQVLADWRRDHLWGITYDVDSTGTEREARVRVVRISDIMDEFAWGMWDPLAVRHFLEYAFRYYDDPGDPGDPPLGYCLFLGDSTNDPRNLGGTPVRDVVPSWEDNRDNINTLVFGNPQYVSDDALARFDGLDAFGCSDPLTDLYIGRIPVNSVEEARDLIRNKVILSESDPQYGRWRTKAILIADDACQGTSPDPLSFSHMHQTDAIAVAIPPEFTYHKIYLYEYGQDCIYNSKPQAKQVLLQDWGEGAWLVNYIGHGADVVWADEHVLDLTDTPLLANAGRYPVVGSFSCSVGKFSNPTRDGLGEAHLRARRGGALVSAAATHLTLSGANFLFNLQFLRELFPGPVNRPVAIGAALMHAKRRITSQAAKYVCLGDPASRLPVPADTLALTGPPRLDRGTAVSVTARVLPPQARSGSLDLEARDAERNLGSGFATYRLPGALLFRGKTALVADTARVGFTVPASLRGGSDGKIQGYAWGTDWDAAGAMFPLEVGGTLGSSADQAGPVITLTVPPGAVHSGDEIAATLEDPSGINLTRLFEFQSILLKVFDRNGIEQFRQDLTERFEYDAGSSTRGSLGLVVPDVEPAPYTFTLSATDNFNNASRTSLVLEVGTPSPIADIESVQGAYPNPFDPGGEPTKLLFSLSRTARVTVRVYSVSGRLVQKAELDGTAGPNVFVWNGRDQGGDAVANGVYLVQLTSRRAGSDETRKILERVVVLR